MLIRMLDLQVKSLWSTTEMYWRPSSFLLFQWISQKYFKNLFRNPRGVSTPRGFRKRSTSQNWIEKRFWNVVLYSPQNIWDFKYGFLPNTWTRKLFQQWRFIRRLLHHCSWNIIEVVVFFHENAFLYLRCNSTLFYILLQKYFQSQIRTLVETSKLSTSEFHLKCSSSGRLLVFIFSSDDIWTESQITKKTPLRMRHIRNSCIQFQNSTRYC